jgi:hypothetical protein
MSTPVPLRSDFDASQLHKLVRDRAIPIRPDVFWRLRRFTPAARARTRPGLAALDCRSCAIGFFASTPRVPTVS